MPFPKERPTRKSNSDCLLLLMVLPVSLQCVEVMRTYVCVSLCERERFIHNQQRARGDRGMIYARNTPFWRSRYTRVAAKGYPFIESPGKLLKDTIRTSGRLVGACVMPVVMRVSEHLSPSSARTSESVFRFVPLQQQEQKNKHTL